MTSIFIDSGIFIALANKSDRDHESAINLVDKIRRGEFGQPYTSDYVFDETLTAALVRARRLEPAVNIGKVILGSKDDGLLPLAKLLRVDQQIFSKAWTDFASGRHKHLSFTDYTILAQVTELKIDGIASLDSGFDGLIKKRMF
ncbi:MAG: type II toxin-antitoxin system VapC family toxin [Nitrososphaerales archaeon]